jgi:hypothetical protein
MSGGNPTLIAGEWVVAVLGLQEGSFAKQLDTAAHPAAQYLVPIPLLEITE